MKFSLARAIGLILTITGIMLALWFFQTFAAPGPAPLFSYIVAAIGLAMLSVGVRYIFKTPNPPKSPPAK